jgi:O-antigen/teichoic acid export membrane protein
MTQTVLPGSERKFSVLALAQSSVIALSLQLAGIFITYLMQIFLARWMGTEEYGLYEYVITWSLLLAVPASLGLPRAVVRLINEYRVQQAWGQLRGLILGSWGLTIFMGLFLSLVCAVIIFVVQSYHPFLAAPVLLIGVWLIPLQGLLLLQEDIARGMESILLAYGPTKLTWPLLAMAGGVALWYFRHDLNSISMIWVALSTLFFVLLIQAVIIWFQVKRNVETAPPVFVPISWLRISLPLLLYRAFREILVQTDILMIGSIVGAGAVGIYSPASKTSLWVSFVLQAVNLAIAPTLTVLYITGDREALQEVISTATKWIFWSASTIAILLIIFAKPILGIFGPDFVDAHWALKVLVIGQFINALSGSVGNLLSMTGYQNKLMIVSSCTALLNLVLNSIFIPLWGIVGAALTTAFTLSVWNIWLAVIVMRYLNINPTVFTTLSMRNE